MKNKILPIICSFMLIFGIPAYSNAEDFSNLTEQQRADYTNKKLAEELNNKKNAPAIIKDGEILIGQRLNATLVVPEKIGGRFTIKNCVIEKDLVLASKNLEIINIEDSKINGNIYILETGDANLVNLRNSTVKDIVVNSPSIIREYGQSKIENIIVTKDYNEKKWLTVKANVKKFVNYKKNLYVKFDGTIDNAVVNQEFNIKGNYKIMTRTQNQDLYQDTVYFDLDDFSSKKGYKDITDKTSYNDMFNFYKKSQAVGKERITFFVKNATKQNVKNLNETFVNKFSYYLPNYVSGIYTSNYNVKDQNLGIFSVNFIFDTETRKIEEAEKILDREYKKIKNLPPVEYIKAVNKFLALNIRYDETLKRHNIYDAMIDNTAVCEGYSKCGYYLLQRKFGKENAMIIINDTHMWNMVRLDGKWYHIDFTYNDPVTKPYNPDNYTENFLLLNDEQMSRVENRKWDRNIYPKAG